MLSVRPTVYIVPPSFAAPRPLRSSRILTRASPMERFEQVIANNKTWAAQKTQEQGDFFSRYADAQYPEFLWVGCADSRVVPNDIMGKQPGDVFAHRNVGNVVSQTDLNCMSVLDYGIGALKVKHVVICGHYGCGAVKASLTLPLKTPGIVNSWLSSIRAVRNKYADKLNSVPADQRPDLLSELNAVEQMVQACTSQAVQTAWTNGQELTVHCVVYDIKTGLMKVLVPGVSSLDELAALPQFKDGIISGDGVKSAFDTSLKGLITLEKATA